MPTAEQTVAWEIESTSFGEVERGDFVLADPVYGAEEVIGYIQKQYLAGGLGSPGFPPHLSEDFYALHLQLRQRGTEGTGRFVVRFPHEPVMRIKIIGA